MFFSSLLKHYMEKEKQMEEFTWKLKEFEKHLSPPALSIKIKEQQNAVLRAGGFVFRAPVGYKNHRTETGIPTLIKDKWSGTVSALFKIYADYDCTLDILRRIARQMELRLTVNQLKSLLMNKVYTGMVFVPESSTVKGFWTKGLHEAIIDELTFHKVVAKLDVQVVE